MTTVDRGDGVAGVGGVGDRRTETKTQEVEVGKAATTKSLVLERSWRRVTGTD